MDQYSSNIGALGPINGTGGTTPTTTTAPKKDNSTLIASILGIVATVVAAVLPKNRDTTYQNPFPGPTVAAQPAGINTTTLLIIGAALLLFMKKK